MPDLFDYVQRNYPDVAGFKDHDTSKKAAASINDRVHLLRGRCLAELRKHPHDGLTADETAAAIGETVLSVRPRFTELLQTGKIEDTGRRRKNESGRSAKIWKAVVQ